ncbi:MAG: hypothetical protein ABH879_03375 [archaeon]
MEKGVSALEIALVVIILCPSAIGYLARCDTAGALRILDYPPGDVYAKTEAGYYFPVSGTWTDKNYKSDDLSLNSSEPYNIKVVSPDGGYSLMTVACPGFRFSCRSMQLGAGKCYKREGGELYLEFSASEVDYRALAFEAVTVDGKFLRYGPFVKDSAFKKVSIAQLGPNRYLLGWTTEEDIKEIAVTHPDCDRKTEEYYTYVVADCQNRFCTEDSDCYSYEFCQDNLLCASLYCTSCETIQGHKCVPKCNDKNYCTKDICTKDYDCEYIYQGGCAYEGGCASELTERFVNGSPMYCSETSTWLPQKRDNSACRISAECINICYQGICMTEVQKNQTEYNATVALTEEQNRLSRRIISLASEYYSRYRHFVFIAMILLSAAAIIYAIYWFFKKETLERLSESLETKLSGANILKNLALASHYLDTRLTYRARRLYVDIIASYEQLPAKERQRVHGNIVDFHNRLKEHLAKFGQSKDIKGIS